MFQFLKLYIIDRAGVAAVEFAMIAPLVVVLFIGTVDYGIFIREQMKIKNATITVAEYIASAGNNINENVIAQRSYGAGFEGVTLNTEFLCECADGVSAACPLDCGEDDYQRRFVSVTMNGTFDAMFPYPGISDSIALRSTTRTRVD